VGSSHFDGQHYHVDGLEGTPLPIQQPMPLLIGGGGPRMIRFAARRADIVAFVPRSLPGGGFDPEEFAAEALHARIATLDAALAEAGRDDPGPERSVLVFEIHPSADEVTHDGWVEPELAPSSPYVLIGEPAAIAETLHERRERWGLSYVVCFERDLEKFIPVVKQLAT
jgi:alkanesulfonate monooxygenase SsuD/methylene tetrahydromethanopterin reductase-like flavin-dependent oxidoreductase (luciferase family)